MKKNKKYLNNQLVRKEKMESYLKDRDEYQQAVTKGKGKEWLKKN